MASLRPTKRFEKSFTRLEERLKVRTRKSIEQFLANPRHPHLHFEKLKTARGFHTIRVDENFRVVLRDAGKGVYDIVDVGSHRDIDKGFG